MDYRDVDSFIEQGEGFEVEFKRKVSSPEKIARALIAFANTGGGHILFGVDDDGTVVGVESEKSEVYLIQEAGQDFCLPPITPEIDIVAYDGTDVIVAYVAESDNKPHQYTGPNEHGEQNTRVYIRVNDKSVLASREVVKVLKDERPDAPPLKLEIGKNEKQLLSYLDSHERITTKEFCRLVNISERRAARTLATLVRAGVIRIHTAERTPYFTLAFDLPR
ncbi:MAG: RNA-binding domain-containing protein [Bacteroidota bacterium]